MGLGKIARGLGKVGLAFEALGYVVTASKGLRTTVWRRSNSSGDSGDFHQSPDADSARDNHSCRDLTLSAPSQARIADTLNPSRSSDNDRSSQ